MCRYCELVAAAGSPPHYRWAKEQCEDMLRLQLYTILDTKAEAFFPPFAAGNAAEALRSFGDLLVDGGSKLAKHPEDYRLYHCGEFDVVNGTVAGHPAGHVLVEDGLKLVAKEA